MINTDDQPYLLLPNEAAAFLRTTRKAIYSLVERGLLPSVRVGRRLLIPRDMMLRSLRESRAPSPEVKRR